MIRNLNNPIINMSRRNRGYRARPPRFGRALLRESKAALRLVRIESPDYRKQEWIIKQRERRFFKALESVSVDEPYSRISRMIV